MTAEIIPAAIAAPGRERRGWRISIERLLSLGTIASMLAAWVVASEFQLVNPLFLPTPQKVLAAFWQVSTHGYQGSLLYQHLDASLARVLAGYLLACMIGLPLGLLMGFSPICKAIFDPLIEFYRPLPPLGIYTLLVMWLGIGDTSKIVLLFLAALPPLTMTSMEAARAVDAKYVRLALSLGASRWDLFRHVYVPSCLPGICTGMRISLGVTYSVLVAAEIVAANRGIGWMIWDASQFMLGDVVVMGLIVLAITGLLLDKIVRSFERAVTPWRFL